MEQNPKPLLPPRCLMDPEGSLRHTASFAGLAFGARSVATCATGACHSRAMVPTPFSMWKSHRKVIQHFLTRNCAVVCFSIFFGRGYIYLCILLILIFGVLQDWVSQFCYILYIYIRKRAYRYFLSGSPYQLSTLAKKNPYPVKVYSRCRWAADIVTCRGCSQRATHGRTSATNWRNSWRKSIQQVCDHMRSKTSLLIVEIVVASTRFTGDHGNQSGFTYWPSRFTYAEWDGTPHLDVLMMDS